MSRQTRSANVGRVGGPLIDELGPLTTPGTPPAQGRVEEVLGEDEEEDYEEPAGQGVEAAGRPTTPDEDDDDEAVFRLVPTVELQLRALRALAEAPPPLENTALDDVAQAIMSKAVGLTLALRRHQIAVAGNPAATARTAAILDQVNVIRQNAAADFEDLGTLIEV